MSDQKGETTIACRLWRAEEIEVTITSGLTETGCDVGKQMARARDLAQWMEFGISVYVLGVYS